METPEAPQDPGVEPDETGGDDPGEESEGGEEGGEGGDEPSEGGFE